MCQSRKIINPMFALLSIVAAIGGAHGKPPSRIQGGRLATNGEFSGVVSLSAPGSFDHSCGGSIIGPRHILTAAHCVHTRRTGDISVRAGINNITDQDHVIERLVSKVYEHSGYNNRTYKNDIAVLELTDDLPLGDRLQTFLLPTHEPEQGYYFLAGWGNNRKNPTTYQFDLKVLFMLLADESRCYGLPEKICAYSDSGASCSGDSGSPLSRRGYVYGIDSTGYCTIGRISNFVNVYRYVDWINAIMRNSPFNVNVR